MSMMGKLMSGLVLGGAALAGSYVGEGLRDGGSEGLGAGIVGNGSAEFDLQKLATAAVPGLVLGILAGWPRSLYAFLGALCTAACLSGRGAQVDRLMDLALSRPDSR